MEDILHERGIDICHETVRYWWNNLGPILSKAVKKNKIKYTSNWRWHIDEVFVKINGKQHYLWRAVDQEGNVLDCFVTKRRDKKAAKKVLVKLVKKHGKPREIVTDKLRSYKAALKELNLQHLQSTEQYSNNQVENSHLNFRRREKVMTRFKSIKSLQKFVSIQSSFLNLFNHQRHIEKRQNFKNLRDNSINEWNGFLVS